MTEVVLGILGILLLILSIIVVRSSSALAAVTLMSAISLTASLCFVLVAALDVALTEVILGAGFVTAFYLRAIGETRGSGND